MIKMKTQHFSVSYKGRREKNEDNVLIKLNKNYSQPQVIIAVADGLGGYHRGDMASKMMIQQLGKLSEEEFAIHPFEFSKTIIRFIKETNRQIYDQGQKMRQGQLGTTVSGAVLRDNSCLFFNVGDSRTYLINASDIQQITLDHSADMESLKNGLITRNEMGQGHYSHALTRSIGTDPEVEVDIFPGKWAFHNLQEGDVILSCTDGLWNAVTEQELYREIVGRKNLEQSLEALASLAYIKNSQDNISIVALEYGCFPRKNMNLGNYTPVKKLQRTAHGKKNNHILTLLIVAIFAFLVVVGLLIFKLSIEGN
jgi:PPM family protein phosphatase